MPEYTWKDKLLSARRFLAICAGLSLLLLVGAYVVRGPHFSVSAEALVAIITSVFMAYFGKEREKNGQ